MQNGERETPWGYELAIVSLPYCSLKRLTVLRGHRSALHFHKERPETVVVTEGIVGIEVGDSSLICGAGESVEIPAGTNHRFTALDGAVLFEFSIRSDAGDTHELEGAGGVA